MLNKEFEKKYDGVIRSIAIAEGGKDMSVGSDMLKYEIRVHAGRVTRQDTYQGIPEDFDWQQATEDLDSITD
ncbi:hypothetical protein [Aminipila terrae]|uniref:Uncharacterized protein n=1 Tax=Aminipila terrae TaxID=2697030 RepID=A0A6P1MLG6_9FIRM|nr:hypothetical protein [Aminipila terrae]QHI72908.1 hypothetical protein Ami3637_11280 [Aminipila terrae]